MTRHHSPFPTSHNLLCIVFCIIAFTDLTLMPVIMATSGKAWTPVTMASAGAPVYWGAWGTILGIGVWKRDREEAPELKP